MLAKNAKKLADILMGLDDTKAELIEAYKESMESDVVPQVLVEAAERWRELTDELEEWFDVVDGVANSSGDRRCGRDDLHSG